MVKADLKKYKLPNKSGVYFFFKNQTILYIGKATSLHDRIKSYFGPDLLLTRGPRLTKMLTEATKISWQETDSALEALILESALIKKHQPKYNAREKDDKSYFFVVITKEIFPRVLLVRGRELFGPQKKEISIKYSYGPFPSGQDLREALKIIRRIFPFRDKCTPCFYSEKIKKCRPCFNYQLGLCPGVCFGKIKPKEYSQIIKHLDLFFNGQKTKLLNSLEKEMKKLAQAEKFEQAQKIKRSWLALKHINDVAFLGRSFAEIQTHRLRFEAYDVAHLAGQNIVGALAVWNDGEIEKKSNRLFKIKTLARGEINDPKALEEILIRRKNHSEWPIPDLIIVDGDERQRQVALKIFPQIPIVAVTKDQNHKASHLAGDSKIIADHRQAIITTNAEAHRLAISFHRKKQREGAII